MRYRN